MIQLSFQLPKPILSASEHLLRKQLDGKRNIIYFAAGHVREGYQDLPYDNVVLVDRNYREPIFYNNKVIRLGLDSIQACALLKKIKVKFDAFVCINEGLSEGGGHYPINGNWSLSNILPIMHDTYLHIACPDYYGQRKWKKMFNLPQEATLLTENDADYISPYIFSDYYKYNKEFCVWKVTKQAGKPATFRLGDRKITVERKNAWDDYDVLDSLFVRCSPCEEKNLMNVAPKAEIIKNYSFKQILQYCNRNKIVQVGFMPWLNHSYNNFLKYLETNQADYPYPKQINFYHLHKNDFQQLYARAAEQVAIS